LLAALNGVPTGASGTTSAQGILDSLVAPASAFAQASTSMVLHWLCCISAKRMYGQRLFWNAAIKPEYNALLVVNF